MNLSKIALATVIASTTATAFANADNKALVASAINAQFVEFDQDTTRELLSEDYIQHNPYVPTGPDALIGILPALKEADFKADTVRLLAEGDLVVAHTVYQNAQLFGGDKLVAFDVWRIENGKLAEHWDNLQPLVSAEQTVSGNSMVDGPSDIVDIDKTAANKTLVSGFVRDVLVEGKGETLANYLAPEYIQHNPQVGNGLDGLTVALKGMADAGVEMKYSKTHMTIAEGNFVFTASEGSLGGKPTAFYDLFRVEDNMIIEHWDVVSEIPAESANSNGKF